MANKQMDEFFEDAPAAETPPPAAEVVVSAPPPEPPSEPAAAPAEPRAQEPPKPAEDEPAAEPDDVAGLRKALLAERGKRNDYKGERDRLSGELEAYKARMADLERRVAAPPPAPPQQVERVAFRSAPNPVEDPNGYAQWLDEKQTNDRANVSEAVLRAEIGDDTQINSAIALFQQAAAANPRLMLALRVHPDPYRWAYEQGKKVEAQRAEQAKSAEFMKQVGSDPQAWLAQQKQQIEADIRARLDAEYANRPMSGAPAVHLPQSLSTARSAAPRQAASAEEVPFDAMFGQRKKRA